MIIHRPDPTPPQFQSVTLFITFESRDELLELYSRLNPSWSDFKAVYRSSLHDDVDLESKDNSFLLWNAVSNILDD